MGQICGRSVKKHSPQAFFVACDGAVTYLRPMSPHARETRPFASEVKFVVNAEVGSRIREWIRANLEADPHGGGLFNDEYGISSLYFDTDAGDVFHRRGSFGRAESTACAATATPRGGVPRAETPEAGHPVEATDTVGVGTLDALQCLDRHKTDARWDGDWFHRRLLLRQQKPVCQISYPRIARTAMTFDGPARLTLDEDVCVTTAREPRFAPEAGRQILPQRMILELKYGDHLPAIFKRLVEDLTLEPARASKIPPPRHDRARGRPASR